MISTVSSVIDAPVEDVWNMIKFNNWGSWLQGMSLTMEDGSEQAPVGSVRVVGGEGGVREKLLMQDETSHTIVYTFDGPSPFAARKYVSTVRLDPITTTGGTFIHWSAAMEADFADEATLDATISGVYGQFIQAISAKLAG